MMNSILYLFSSIFVLSSMIMSEAFATASSSTASSAIFSVSNNNRRIRKTTAVPLPFGLSRGGGFSSSSGTTKKKPTSSSSSLFTAASGNDGAENCPFAKSMAAFGSVWGSFGVVYVLAKAIKRVLPIAVEPFSSGTLLLFTPVQWSLYAASCAFFAYAEGYKGFHLKFAPLVVKRSFTLVMGTRQGNNPVNYLLAPLYSMGLFAATKKRLITSWSVSLGVAAIVAVVKKLNPVPRCILDAGVVVGLSLGSLSILYHYIKSIITGKLPDVDPCLPANKDDNKSK